MMMHTPPWYVQWWDFLTGSSFYVNVGPFGIALVAGVVVIIGVAALVMARKR